MDDEIEPCQQPGLRRQGQITSQYLLLAKYIQPGLKPEIYVVIGEDDLFEESLWPETSLNVLLRDKVCVILDEFNL